MDTETLPLDHPFDPDLVSPPAAPRAPLALKPAAAIAAFALFLVIAMWVAVWSFLHNEYVTDVAVHKREDANVARALEEQTVRVLVAADAALLLVKQRVESQHRDVDLARIAKETGLTPKILAQLSLLNRDGNLVATNLDGGHGKTAQSKDSDREHFRVHAASDAGALYIGPTIIERSSGRPMIPLSRRLNTPEGGFDGVAVASIDPTYFTDFYGQVHLGGHGTVSLTTLDGAVLARSVGGQAFETANPINAHISHIADAVSLASSGSYIAADPGDDAPHIYSFRRFADYPLVISVSSSMPDALAHYKANRRVYTGLAAVFTLVVIAAVVSLILTFDRLLAMTEALRQREARAQGANRMKSEFLASMSLELREPLASIRGFAELMDKRLEHPAHREQAAVAGRAAEHLADVLNDVLDISRIEAGAMEIVSKRLDIRHLVTEVADQFRSAAEAKDLELHLQVDVDVPQAASWDEARVKQILSNLVSNAIKFTRAGLVALQISRHGERIVMSVLDTGPGIPQNQQDSLFERFRQRDADLSQRLRGSGLGLALSRSFAQLMGGDLTVDSTPGQGSRFILTLPLGAASPSEEKAALPLAA